MDKPEVEALVIGSGFAGAVTAARLAQAGIEVCVLERGRRYDAFDFPTYPFERRVAKRGEDEEAERREYEPPRDFARWLWPVDQGLWDVRDLGDIQAAQAAGYGGGSLVYANVHLRAPYEVFQASEDSDALAWPDWYRNKGALDGYYNLAAFMLDVQSLPQAKQDDLAKARRLREAGEQNDNWFSTPLAVNFSDKPRSERWTKAGKKQRACDLRGYCCMGCNTQAKNTLDFNYLAIAENPGSDGRPARVITLAEVTKIGREDGGDLLTVEYFDHLLRRPKAIVARHVFLCAGSLNTTQLLMKSRDDPDSNPFETKPELLGHGYYPNGDAIAAVFECQRPQEVDRGPTITGSLLYEIDKQWFLVQDGGVPNELDLVLGVFRSPLWLRRNRYLERPPSDQTRGLRSYRHLRRTGARELIAMLPPHGAEPVQGTVGIDWPKWLTQAVKAGGQNLLQRLSVAAEPLAERTLDQLALYLQYRFDELAEVLPNGKEMLKKATDLGLARGVLRLGAQLLWGSESDAVRRGVEAVLRAAPKNLDETTKTLISALRWAADYRPGDGHTGVLLTMGRDPHPATLVYDKSDEDNPLKAKDNHPQQRPLRKQQELAMRDIAKQWRGELRTNPMWAFARKRITVHSQGGCPMGNSPEVGVTDADGNVFGCPGVYVMDAAAFPRAVGVNPSATIAAVAERKVESFIRKHLENSDWQAPEWREAQQWGGDPHVAAMLDPLATTRPASQAEAEVVGLKFSERMRGHYSPLGASADTSILRLTSSFHDVDPWSRRSIEQISREYEKAEIAGIRAKRPRESGPAEEGIPDQGEIAVFLNATIEDLTEFLDVAASRGAMARGVRIPLSGSVLFGESAHGEPEKDAPGNVTRGSLRFFRVARDERTDNADAERRPRARSRRKMLEYELHFSHDGHDYTLRGAKVIEDDPRLDVWQDTSTLFFDIAEDGGKQRRGVLRLPAAELMKRQIKSFEITGTDDPDRRVWALTAFFVYFFGQLAESYVPELKRLPPLLRNMLMRTHG